MRCQVTGGAVERVKASVDGFNKPAQHLIEVQYFTARVRNQPESEQAALATP